MEKVKRYSLPPIFKFSCICNILPYYDYLPKWILTMKKLNSETMRIWEENREAFMTVGKESRITPSMNNLESIIESSNYEERLELYKSFVFIKSARKELINVILFLIKNDKKVILEQSYQNDLYCNLILSEEDIDEDACDPLFNNEKKFFESNSIAFLGYAFRLMEKRLVMCSKRDNKICIQLIPSSVLYAYNYTAFMKDYNSDREDYFRKCCGFNSTTLILNSFKAINYQEIQQIIKTEKL